MTDLQPQIEAKGLEIFELMRGEVPAAFSGRGIAGRLMSWAMQDEDLKVRLFRFVDVLPSLSTSEEIARHVGDYLEDAQRLPWLATWAVRNSTRMPWLTAFAARKGVTRMAKTFVLASKPSSAIPVLRRMRKWPVAFTVDLLGETVVSEKEAEEYQRRYINLVEHLAFEARSWKPVEQIDCDDRGPIPPVNVSIKVSAFYSQIHSTDPEGAVEGLANRIYPLMVLAVKHGVFVNFDMESMGLKDVTIALFKRLLSESALRDYPYAGIALQGYLRTAQQDVCGLVEWVKERNCPITIRLIKGAYWDYETIMARQRGWPVPVFQSKAETDANYELLARYMLENADWVRCAFGTHNIRSIAACLAHADALNRPARSFEFQMLYGMAEPIKRALIRMGLRVRDYCPVGEILPGMSYLVRRLLENTSNEGFLKATFVQNASPKKLLQDPRLVTVKKLEHLDGHNRNGPNEKTFSSAASRRLTCQNGQATGQKSTFQNEPPTDYTIAANRDRMKSAIEKVRSGLGKRYPIIIGGKEYWGSPEIVSINPSRPEEIVGRVIKAGKIEAEAAVGCARTAFASWSRTPVAKRAAVLERLAAILNEERFEFAALEVFETGKNWTESDADVAEAIDFCRYYADEMLRISHHRYQIPGEESCMHYVARGVALVIAPWNFPLAILCGMTTAALVAGNTVIMKPSEQSSVVAAWLADALRRAGVPPGVVSFLPGDGAEVGEYLVNHPSIDIIAFTGSREVGLKIFEAAGKVRSGQMQLKKVICEMGGKNAVIVDSDADIDEAIPGIVYSAFGFQGQKCSALSRLILLKEQYDRVVERLIESAKSLRLAPPEDPASSIGPVIDQDAFNRIINYIELGKREARLVFQAAGVPKHGFFVPPTIFVDVPPHARIAQEEIFGPVLSVFRAHNLDEAIALANSTQYALTGGIYSRSPGNIERVKAELAVGNLYINRGITGALVARHPFGGFRMSGTGTKAGGSEYLQNFLFARVTTENLMRRGFAPEEGGVQNGELLAAE